VFKQFLNHIDRNQLFASVDKILLAVSGGLDSMVMLHLFKEAGFKVGVVHCNFQLRGAESEGDEAFVQTRCAAYGIPFHVSRFETEKFAHRNGTSVQMAARTLRYNFFATVCREEGYQCIATAHHLNDSIETVLLNLTRGTGIEGLTGISVANDSDVKRPMLFATRAAILDYAHLHQLQWREDASNVNDKYQRNLIRNQVIPLLKTINPALESNFQDTLERLQMTANLQQAAVAQFRREAIRDSENQTLINKAKLALQVSPAVMLWELIKSKGFNYYQCKTIVAVEHQSGKVFYSGNYQLTVDREDLILSVKSNLPGVEVQIEANDVTAQFDNNVLAFTQVEKDTFVVDSAPGIAQLDLDTIRFPLTWRVWQEGDHFIPLGMKKHKKVSDFLIDAKVPRPEKERVTVVLSEGEIVWVAGYRIAEPFKIAGNTRRVLVIKLNLGYGLST
jgi:tRNA(Ile)-lysidine synthase